MRWGILPRAWVGSANAVGGDFWKRPTVNSSIDNGISKCLALTELAPLCQRIIGVPEIVVAVIDGPVATSLDTRNGAIRRIGPAATSCETSSAACAHGTHVTSLLASTRGSSPPGLCPGCTFLIHPLFDENAVQPSASADALAEALLDVIAAGASIVNLSVAVRTADPIGAAKLTSALNEALRKGVLVVAAAGNEGAVAGSPLTTHPWVIPVAGCDLRGNVSEITNLSRSVAQRGLLAPAEGVPTRGLDGKIKIFQGTSAAVPFVTGAAALLWSAFPTAKAADVKRALVGPQPRRVRGLIPPRLNAQRAFETLEQLATGRRRGMDQADVVDMSETVKAKSNPKEGRSTEVVPQGAGGGCSCGGPAQAEPPQFIYALGQIRPRFPTLDTEKEYMQVSAKQDASGLTDAANLHAVISRRENRYLARRICWVFTVEGLETYLLHPRDPADLDLLIEAVRPRPRPTDIDVVIGLRGPIAPPHACAGLQVPMVAFDNLYSFKTDELLKAIPRPKGTKGEKQESEFQQTAEEVLSRIMQLADNAGATDEHRALNYLAVRCASLYACVAEAHQRNETLRSVDVRPSRLSGVRRIVDVVFTFGNRTTDVSDKSFVRVDVTEQFPFLVTKLSPYYDR